MEASQIVTSIAIAVISSSGLSSLLTMILTRIFNKKDKRKIETKATRFNLLINLQNEARRIITAGYITRLEYKQFCEAYDIYKALGGDGYADELRQQIDEINKLTIQGGISA